MSRRKAVAARLRPARGAEHPAAHHLSGADRRPDAERRRRMGCRRRAADPAAERPYADVTARSSASRCTIPHRRNWWIAFFGGSSLLLGCSSSPPACFSGRRRRLGQQHPRQLGHSRSRNYIWWLGIGHAGTLISAMLLLLDAALAQFAQPLCGSHDSFAVDLRGPLPDPASRAARGSSIGWRPIPT